MNYKMKILKNIFMTLFLLGLPGTFASCTGDDKESYENAELSSYIIGTWHSYYAEVYGNGEKKSVDITKNNEYSAMYIEAVFMQNGKVKLYSWQPDNNGLNKWIEENCLYTVKGNTVEIYDVSAEKNSDSQSQGIGFNIHGGYTTRASVNDDAVTLMFEPSNRSLFIKVTGRNQYGIDFVGNIYLKK